ncbi:MAG: mandelate racemase/muconate lactonizing enzyme family protein [Ectothiorhodospiraceae bacterium]|nr:mandelate racemase/muconate lactonizing enzyme family protein [Chromatiales bacterium]MCP5154144.1 mandelate racemase/muconate lactonizing enzyme family protein [Ectothiorhodospiraceae bacterium]
MRVEGFETLHCDAGWRKFSFLKIVAEDGTTGISEYNESYGSPRLTGVIESLLDNVVGKPALGHERISAELYARTRAAHGGIAQQAIAAIENAMVDLKARKLGVPVYELLGGQMRERLRLYWSHCGSYRLPRTAELMGREPLRSVDDLVGLTREVAERGFSALKTNIFLFDGEARMHMPGFARAGGWPELNPDRKMIRAMREQLAAMREGAGEDVDILLDLNFNFRTEGYLTVTRALDDLGLGWFEIDIYDPEALALIRRSVRTPIASCESLFGLRGYRPFLDAKAMDVCIVDVPWNGIWQSLKIAAVAESHEVNCAPHNFYGHLSTLMSAHFCAAIPNFRIMEIDIDDVPWKDDLVTRVPIIEDGHLRIPDGPGWGAELNEEAIRAHPPREAAPAAHDRGMG